MTALAHTPGTPEYAQAAAEWSAVLEVAQFRADLVLRVVELATGTRSATADDERLIAAMTSVLREQCPNAWAHRRAQRDEYDAVLATWTARPEGENR